MCNCKNQPEFKKLLIQAADFTKRLSGTWVVYKVPSTNRIAVGEESMVKQIEGVCCYTLPNGFEVENKAVEIENSNAETVNENLETTRTKKKTTKG